MTLDPTIAQIQKNLVSFMLITRFIAINVNFQFHTAGNQCFSLYSQKFIKLEHELFCIRKNSKLLRESIFEKRETNQRKLTST